LSHHITEQHNDYVQGMAGPWDGQKTKELVLALTNHDLFLYFGHGSGMPYTDKNIFFHFVSHLHWRLSLFKISFLQFVAELGEVSPYVV